MSLFRKQQQRPTYLINGFLDSGKTSFYRYTIDQPYFRTKGKTLLILCEEGEEEYTDALLERTNTVVEVLEDEAEFTVEHLRELDEKHDPERVLIEYNGMWNCKDMALPQNWAMEQQITTIDASSFRMYFSNMKSLVADQIRMSELILFNRCDDVKDELPAFKRNVKAINQMAEIVFEDEKGEVDVTLDEDLPFDLNTDPIELTDYGYGMFFLDALEHPDRYENKNVRFTGMVLKPKNFPDGYFVPGRMAMTCCAEDMQFLGFKTKFENTDALSNKEWVDVTAKVTVDYVEEYGGNGPVLEAQSVKMTSKPKNQVIDFSAPPA